MVDAHNGVPLKLNSLIIVCGMKENQGIGIKIL